jgi:hypothetical protein
MILYKSTKILIIASLTIILLSLASCGKPVSGNTKSLAYGPQFLLAEEIPNLPAPDSIPQLKYTPITSIFPNYSEITNGERPEEILLKLRTLSSLTNNYHQELLEVLKSTTYIDNVHLMLIADAVYFPAVSYDLMIKTLNGPILCENISNQACQAKISQIKSNIQSALTFGDFTNQILLHGLSKLNQITTQEAYILLGKSFSLTSSVDSLFMTTLKKLDNLTGEEKLNLMELALLKSANTSALALALDWFKNDSDKSFDSLMATAKKFTIQTDVLDDFLFNASDLISNMTAAQAKQISLLAINQVKIAQKTLRKVHNINATELASLVSICKNAEEKDLLISSGVAQINSATPAEAVDLIRQAGKNKIQITQSLISLIKNFKIADLLMIAENLAYGDDRGEIIITNLEKFSTLTALEARSLADQAGNNKTRLVLSLIPKIPALTALDLAHIVETINLGPDRDQALIAGVKLVKSADVVGVTAVLNIAYNSKLEVTKALFAKAGTFTASDLALISNNCANAVTRDQLLIEGSAFVSLASVDGVIAMINQSTQEKVKVALAVIAKMPDASSTDLGLILKSIADGPTRDRLIDGALKLLKKFNGDGSALVVERSFDNKVSNATKLITLIPTATGTDLFKILSVCGSGNTRDLILASSVKLLGKLTKNEAKSLYTKAYNNKESVAILLMSKVDDIDGETVGEIALLTGKGSTRDLIISKGLLRLKKIDIKGLIAMIKAADKLVTKLALEVSSTITNLNVDNAVDISKALSNIALRDRFLIHAIDIIIDLDEPSITSLALEASNQTTKEEIVRKGVEKMGDAL